MTDLTIRVISTIALLALFIGALVASADSRTVRETRVCFSAKKWDAPKGERPCAQIVRIFEDGSTRIRITNARGELIGVVGAGTPN